MKRAFLVLAFMAFGSTLHAQSGIELTPFIGFRGGGELRSDTFTADGDVDIKDGESYGIILGIPMAPWAMIELEAGFQDSLLQDKGGDFDPGLTIGGVDVNYYQVGFVFQNPGPRLQGFGVFSLGATSIRPDLPGLSSETKFSTAFGGGIKINFSQNLGLRLEGRGYYTLIDTNRDHDCCSYYYTDDLWQGEARVGLVVRF